MQIGKLKISDRVESFGISDVGEDPVEQWCRRHEQEGTPVLDLICTNPTQVGLDYSGYNAVFSETVRLPGMLMYEPNPAGLLPIRQSICDHFHQTYNLPLDANDLLLTSSTSESYTALMDLLTDPGDAVLLPKPGYPLVEVITATAGVRMESYHLKQLDNGQWVMDVDSVEAAIHERTRAIICISPHNPTGSTLRLVELKRLEALCIKHGIALIVDEVFRDYTIDDVLEHLNAIYGLKCPTFILNGMSKLAALPQLKLAWIALGGTSEFRKQMRPLVEYLLDTQLSVSNFSQWVIPGLFPRVSVIQAQIRHRCLENAKLLQSFADPLNLQMDPYIGGWYGIIREDQRWSGADVGILLARHCGIKIHPGYFYDLPDGGAMVFSLLVQPDVFAVGIERIRTFLYD